MISLIAACGENQVIGYKNQLPWHLPNDLKHFKKITTGHTIVMGRSTYESIGRPLPNRKNIVLTHNRAFTAEGITVVHHFDEVIALEEVMVIGGASVYQQFLPYAEYLYITKIHHAFAGDAFFPDWDRQQFELIAQEEGIEDEQNLYPHTFYQYKKLTKTTQ
jgi:dihydrofolate reductase